MKLVLDTEQQHRFSEAARTLLAPLDYPSLGAWRREVLARVTGLVGAEAGGFLLPVPGQSPFDLHNLPDRFGTEFMEDQVQRAMVRGWVEDGAPRVWSTRLLGALAGFRMPDEWFASPEYQGLYGRYGLEDAVGFFTSLESVHGAGGNGPSAAATAHPRLPAMLTCFRRAYGSEAFGDRGLALMQMLQPAAEAGVMTVVRHAGAMAAVAQILEHTRAGALVVDARGREVHRNPALERMLRDEPQAGAIRAGIAASAGALAPMYRAPLPAAAFEELSGAARTVRTARGRYRIWATLLAGFGVKGGPATLVQVERTEPELPGLRELRDRWGLTPQQARVARFLARGRTNREIARALRIRPSTARGYTEAVFLKLGVRTRGEVALRILRGPGDSGFPGD